MPFLHNDTSQYWRDISSEGIFKDMLSSFPDIIKKNRFQFNFPFFIFSDHLPSKEDLHKILEESLKNDQSDRHVIIVVKSRDKKNAVKCWSILGEGVHDIFEWVSEEDLIGYVESIAERNRKVNEILNSGLVKKNLVGESAV